MRFLTIVILLLATTLLTAQSEADFTKKEMNLLAVLDYYIEYTLESDTLLHTKTIRADSARIYYRTSTVAQVFESPAVSDYVLLADFPQWEPILVLIKDRFTGQSKAIPYKSIIRKERL